MFIYLFLVDNDPLRISSNLSDLDLFSAPIDNMGLDKVFVINLARRTERRNRMLYCLNELGLNATFVEATDGRLVIKIINMYRTRIGNLKRILQMIYYVKCNQVAMVLCI